MHIKHLTHILEVRGYRFSYVISMSDRWKTGRSFFLSPWITQNWASEDLGTNHRGIGTIVTRDVSELRQISFAYGQSACAAGIGYFRRMEIKNLSTASLRVYARQQLSTSLKGTINGALNWSAILGAGLIGSFLSATGRSPMIFDDTLWGTVETGLACTAVTWLALFAFRFIFVVPYTQWKAGLEASRTPKDDLRPELLGRSETKGFWMPCFTPSTSGGRWKVSWFSATSLEQTLFS